MGQSLTLNRRAFGVLGMLGAAEMALGGRTKAFAADAAERGVSAAGTIDPVEFLDPELRSAARQLLASDNLILSDEGLAELRRNGEDTIAPSLPDVSVEPKTVLAVRGLPEVTVYVINGDGQDSRPSILHMHGGGHVLGAARYELRYLQELARELDCVVVTVEYRLAPETRYAGSVEDNYAALRWMHGAAEELGLDPARIALLGESAGGTHAALLAIKARNRGEVPVCFQALVYPMLDDRTGSTIQVQPWMGRVLWDAAANRYGWTSFLGVEAGRPDVPVDGVPARIADLSGLPPTWIGCGGADLFVSEDIEYARRLTDAGVATELLIVPRAFHAFDRVAPDASISRRFTTSKVSALRRAFGRLVL